MIDSCLCDNAFGLNVIICIGNVSSAPAIAIEGFQLARLWIWHPPMWHHGADFI